jgi:hypothetical protein
VVDSTVGEKRTLFLRFAGFVAASSEVVEIDSSDDSKGASPLASPLGAIDCSPLLNMLSAEGWQAKALAFAGCPLTAPFIMGMPLTGLLLTAVLISMGGCSVGWLGAG